jgi:hypothetical protein
MKVNRPTEEQIRARAYEIYLQRGGQHGHDRDDWLQAEYDLMQLPIRKISQLPPPKPAKVGASTRSLVGLVHAALFLGTAALSNFRR